MNWVKDDCELTDDPARLDLDAVCGLLADTYWAGNRSRELLAEAFRGSFFVSLFHRGRQIGFARAVTDYATFTWICDVIIHPDQRGRGLGKWMVKCLIDHPKIQTCSQVLATRDAHTLYEAYGFQRTEYLKRIPGPSPSPAKTTGCS